MTSRIDAIPFKDTLAPGAIGSSTWEGKKYGLPFVMDLSVWMYNKKLFTQAGLDPNKPPTTLAEFAADARAVAKLGGGVSGTFFGGNCGGCGVFTWWPILWADGQQVMSADGTTSLLASDEAKAFYQVFKDLVADGTALMPNSKTEAGPTWTGYFPKGNIGIMPMPASLVGVANDNLADSDIGVTPIAGINGGQSTFVGGDAIAVTKDSKTVDQAWNFIAWLEGDDAQVNVIAKPASEGGLGAVVSRSDLANNTYSAADPPAGAVQHGRGQGGDPVRRELQRSVQRSPEPVDRPVSRCDLQRCRIGEDRLRQRGRHEHPQGPVAPAHSATSGGSPVPKSPRTDWRTVE